MVGLWLCDGGGVDDDMVSGFDGFFQAANLEFGLRGEED